MPSTLSRFFARAGESWERVFCGFLTNAEFIPPRHSVIYGNNRLVYSGKPNEDQHLEIIVK